MEIDTLRELYQEVILDHNRHPRNCHDLLEANCHGNGFNPLCGDKIQLHLYINAADTIEKVAFTGAGCAIAVASASLMTEALKGLSCQDAEKLFQQMHSALTEKNSPVDITQLGKLAALVGAKAFPARVKCATLAWHTLHNALTHPSDVATTE